MERTTLLHVNKNVYNVPYVGIKSTYITLTESNCKGVVKRLCQMICVIEVYR